MSLVLENQSLPLHVDADGVTRVAHTRVTLETMIAAFAKGATAEQIAQDYPVVPLADIYAVIAFYLRQSEAVDAYLAAQCRTGQQAAPAPPDGGAVRSPRHSRPPPRPSPIAGTA